MSHSDTQPVPVNHISSPLYRRQNSLVETRRQDMYLTIQKGHCRRDIGYNWRISLGCIINGPDRLFQDEDTARTTIIFIVSGPHLSALCPESRSSIANMANSWLA